MVGERHRCRPFNDIIEAHAVQFLKSRLKRLAFGPQDDVCSKTNRRLGSRVQLDYSTLRVRRTTDCIRCL
jgi:hypothetical protein